VEKYNLNRGEKMVVFSAVAITTVADKYCLYLTDASFHVMSSE
jgi:hypothetical protein